MKEFLFYCRSGYEADLQAELIQQFAEKGLYTYAKFVKNSGFIRLILTNEQTKNNQNKSFQALGPPLEQLIFARQKLYVIADIEFASNNRVLDIVEYIITADLPLFGKVMVEHADSDAGKKIAKFCKKFVVPLRAALRKHKLLAGKEQHTDKLPNLHVFIQNSAACTLALSLANDRSEMPLGIRRLKMATDAPSRSSLKLEEAMLSFLNDKQRDSLFTGAMRAVDLGACPGGWTYQMVKRQLTVEAVDHGKIDECLLQTGLVEYYAEDGFLYEPKEGNVDWLLCDMIEQPTRVSQLMLAWLSQGKANAAIFNLKLPMSKRHKVVYSILETLRQELSEKFGNTVIIKAKHLFHNRDEVTVFIIVNSQLLASYQAFRE